MPKPKPMTIGLPGGVQVPIPQWTTPAFGVIAVVAIAFGAYRYLFPFEPELVNVKQANHLLRLEVQEYNRHIVETPVLTLDGPEKTLRVTAFADGCIVVAQKVGVSFSTRLLVDPSRADLEHRKGDEARERHDGPLFTLADFTPIVVAAAAQRQPVCLNPHPGKFTWRYGERARGEACWTPVIRLFGDGCEHVQMFNACANSWATEKDGSPQIRWTRCVH